ncbi:beta-ketoacyl synthase N-terminal-like domain-containing protein [Streptomyces sp. NPDC051207]|uniref:beta-ketoacyl synthase N-terminal-like domain-containing protein n=1 Tax=Streptomyces sp. NPDC051207 TaxID=3154641 RepID=UPI0034275F22
MTQDFVVSAVGTLAPPHPGATGWFDQRAELGRGYRHLPTAAQYLLAAVKRVLAQQGAADGLSAVPEERRAVAVGTNHAVAALHAEIDRATVEGEARLLSPTAVPYFSPNLIASRVAMEHALKGFSLAVHTPRTAGLEALQTGLRALRSGRADWLLAGATEVVPPESDKAAVTVRGAAEDGALALVVESARSVRDRGLRALGRVEARSLFVPPHQGAGAPLTALLQDLGVPSAAAVRVAGDGSPLAAAVAAVLGVAAEPAGAGSLRPLQAVAAALSGPTAPQLVVAVTGAGHVTAVLVTTSTPQ